ncbi:hypothetical protein RN001_015709 [Aquatica leii]|uniref:Coiled-coil domain-containing protein n=1 Tax=Aquatica leii TaxID=1421715 RepID=A0AAN7NTL7_9COLE|nr:hypothetical protein RN001_015709 [Aquatica leii]
MPKKFAGENSKAAAARARKSAVKDEQAAVKQKLADEQYWKEDDKNVLRKLQRKEEQEKKKQIAADKKAEVKALLDEETVTTKKAVKVPPKQKVTRAQIVENIVKPVKKEKEKIETHLDVPLEENINRIIPTAEEAHTVMDAIALLSTKDEEVDKHPEKRMKAAYTAFEQRRMVTLKEEFPTLRLSQLKQMIFKEWQKSPENPLNNQ